MNSRKILLERDGALAIVKFNDPANMNAFDDEMGEQFVAVMSQQIADETVRAVLLTGEGRSFCAGANLKKMFGEQSRGEIPDVGLTIRKYVNPTLLCMKESNKPVVAAVNGPAVGVGCGIALAADIVLIGQSAYFFQSFIRRGVVPDGGSSWLIPRLAGYGRAAAMMMLGEKIDAQTAVQWGLAYRMFEDAELMNAAHAMSTGLAAGPTAAYGRIKEMLRMGVRNDFATQLELEAMHQVGAFSSQDCQEGIAAFIEKREPVFKGN